MGVQALGIVWVYRVSWLYGCFCFWGEEGCSGFRILWVFWGFRLYAGFYPTLWRGLVGL